MHAPDSDIGFGECSFRPRKNAGGVIVVFVDGSHGVGMERWGHANIYFLRSFRHLTPPLLDKNYGRLMRNVAARRSANYLFVKTIA